MVNQAFASESVVGAATGRLGVPEERRDRDFLRRRRYPLLGQRGSGVVVLAGLPRLSRAEAASTIGAECATRGGPAGDHAERPP